MKTTLFLIRHAQSHPSTELHHSEWPLSAVGRGQAARLAEMLGILKIEVVFSSPFIRCRQTIEPFVSRGGLALYVNEDLRERLVTKQIIDGFDKIWRRSWEDFDYTLPGCESSAAAQRRFVEAVQRIAESNRGRTIGISSHGAVIALFLNWIDAGVGIRDAEELTNPDVIKVEWDGEGYLWDRRFVLPGIETIATDHRETPIDRGKP
jgi:2,3-bisphosphoglycerate-dependent phosphoglycerate mutase